MNKIKSLKKLLIIITIIFCISFTLFKNKTININTESNSYYAQNFKVQSIYKNNNFLCDKNDALSKKIKQYWKWVVILVPIALLCFCTYDFIKATTSGKSDAIQKSASASIKRTVAALILLLSPTIVDIVFSWFGLAFCF